MEHEQAEQLLLSTYRDRIGDWSSRHMAIEDLRRGSGLPLEVVHAVLLGWAASGRAVLDAGHKGWATEEHRVAALVWEGTYCPYVALPEVTREGLTR